MRGITIRPMALYLSLLLGIVLVYAVYREVVPTAVVGLVTIDGKPLQLDQATKRCTVVFHPIGGGPVATGIVANDGTYQISSSQAVHLVPGEYLVAVRAAKMMPWQEKDTELPIWRPVTPEMYANPVESELSFSVAPGNNRFDISLRSDAGPITYEKEGPFAPADGAVAADYTVDDTTDTDLQLEGGDTQIQSHGADGSAVEFRNNQ
jgi:hypothetical protein